MNKNIILYWIPTAIFCGIMLFSASMYFTKYEMIKGFFAMMHYPSYLVYPLAIAKILGVIAVITNKSKMLKEWAYAGFFINTTLATIAHLNLNTHDGGYLMALVALVMVVLSRFFWKQKM